MITKSLKIAVTSGDLSSDGENVSPDDEARVKKETLFRHSKKVNKLLSPVDYKNVFML